MRPVKQARLLEKNKWETLILEEIELYWDDNVVEFFFEKLSPKSTRQ